MQTEVLSPRRQIARELSKLYAELAGTEDKPAPRFSVARALREMCSPRGLRSGFEYEICQGTALAADRSYDPNRICLPWGAIGSRLMTAAGSNGSDLLVSTDVGPVADALRPWSVTMSAGVTVFPNLRSNISFPIVSGDIVGAWLADENTAATPTDPTLDAVAVSPKTFSAICQFSHQFTKQVEVAEPFVRAQLLRIAGRAGDQGILDGSGVSGEINGLTKVDGVTVDGSSLDFSDVLTMREAVSSANDLRLSWIADPATRKLLAGRQTFSGGSNAIWQDNMIDGRPAYCTPDAPANTLFLADFSTVAVGLWGPGLRVEINPYQDFSKGIVAARVLFDVDMCVLQKGALRIATGVS
ncbi:MAG TPA: phage major capsid protein [Casimicrobiaceae bacterium]